ncbi:Uncharacterized protein Fot_41804 [Forsythia ovata]|uniref:Uncharacterized protein n=1 Tax=Forsythia ovata TaxID=205694 RepID=A0ABD1RKT5_9LAMI
MNDEGFFQAGLGEAKCNRKANKVFEDVHFATNCRYDGSLCKGIMRLRKSVKDYSYGDNLHGRRMRGHNPTRNKFQVNDNGGGTGQLSGGRKSISRTSRHGGAARASGGLKYP